MLKISNPQQKETGDSSFSSIRDNIVTWHRALFIIIVLSSVLYYPVLAHSAAQMGVAPDQYDTGIPVYWPFHATLMTAGFSILVAGMVIMRYHKTSNWYKTHKTLQIMGGASVIAGLSIAIGMVSLSGISHLISFHGILGAVTIVLLLSTLAIGSFVISSPDKKAAVAPAHRWMGRIAIGLVVLNIILGISMMGAVLAK
jgi:hypothetical protein